VARGSGDQGWSAYSTAEECWHKYYRKYVLEPAMPEVPRVDDEDDGRAVGTGCHAALALYYAAVIQGKEPMRDTPGGIPWLWARLRAAGCNPALVAQCESLIEAYFHNYEVDYLVPYAVEYRATHNGKSCRYDLVADIKKRSAPHPVGRYNVEHKFFAANSAHTRQWDLNGEILGQGAVWPTSQLGWLQGTLVNVTYKTKIPSFERYYVAHTRSKFHLATLDSFDRMKATAAALGWPRSVRSCVPFAGNPCVYYNDCLTATIDKKEE
jgi:hypothetical protein